MKTAKQLIDLLKISAEDKANEAFIMQDKYPEPENKKYYFGRYTAFDEFYKLLCNFEKQIR